VTFGKLETVVFMLSNKKVDRPIAETIQTMRIVVKVCGSSPGLRNEFLLFDLAWCSLEQFFFRLPLFW
jgi:uncharacterized membrane protein